jgi:hypothetical protein
MTNYKLVPISWNWRGEEVGKKRYEASTCFMAWDVSEEYQSQICWLLAHLEISIVCDVSEKSLCTDSSH